MDILVAVCVLEHMPHFVVWWNLKRHLQGLWRLQPPVFIVGLSAQEVQEVQFRKKFHCEFGGEQNTQWKLNYLNLVPFMKDESLKRLEIITHVLILFTP